MDDAKRPPVLAHQRFAAASESYRGLNLAERFVRIHQTNLWGADSSKSGLGSEDAATTALLEQLPSVLGPLGTGRLLDGPLRRCHLPIWWLIMSASTSCRS